MPHSGLLRGGGTGADFFEGGSLRRERPPEIPRGRGGWVPLRCQRRRGGPGGRQERTECAAPPRGGVDSIAHASPFLTQVARKGRCQLSRIQTIDVGGR